MNDGNDDGAIDDDELGTTPSENISYDVGAGSVTQFIDSTHVYNVTVETQDGSLLNILATSIQTQNGDVFLTDMANNGSFDNLVVRNFELTSVFEDNYASFIADSSVDNTRSVCFLTGTLIDTPLGTQPVETLMAGDLVRTLDHGDVPILGVFSSAVPDAAAAQPVVIPKGALSDGLPERDLCVSPQHRLFCGSRVADRMFGTAQVLISAKFFRNHLDTAPAPQMPRPRYWHIFCKHHEIIFAQGYPSEIMMPGDMALRALGQTPAGLIAQRLARDILARGPAKPARCIPKGAHQRQFVNRMIANKRNFLEQAGQHQSTRLPAFAAPPVGAFHHAHTP